MALKEWQNTNSPITHWYNMAMRYLDSDSVFYEPNKLHALPSDYNSFFYGLPKKDAQEMCKTMYRETIAKVTIEILDPMVMQIKKDTRTTFTERLAVVGKIIKRKC